VPSTIMPMAKDPPRHVVRLVSLDADLALINHELVPRLMFTLAILSPMIRHEFITKHTEFGSRAFCPAIDILILHQ
jgi:hypothetical protein